MSEEFTVNSHFEGRAPILRKTYDHLIKVLGRFGPLKEEPHKTSIHLVNHSALAGVEVRRDYILLNVKADHEIQSPRVVKTEKISAKRFHHKFKLSAPKEIDAEMKNWLKEAYELSE